MPMSHRLLRAVAKRVQAVLVYGLLKTISNNNITTLSGDRIRSISNA